MYGCSVAEGVVVEGLSRVSAHMQEEAEVSEAIQSESARLEAARAPLEDQVALLRQQIEQQRSQQAT